MAELEITDLEVSYGRRGTTPTTAISGLSLSVEHGEFISILGPSGCGKTTVLKALSGLLTPTSGDIKMPEPPTGADASSYSMVFQDASLFPWYRISRNVAYGLECRGYSRKDALEKSKPLLDLVGLGDFGEHFPHEVSGGMQQRANLARALAVNPALLLMDEPFAALDAQTRELMQAELLRVWSETTKTVLFVTHSIAEAVYLSDRVIVLSSRPGRVIADIRIELPRPREELMRVAADFRAYEEQIRLLIEDQVGRDRQARAS